MRKMQPLTKIFIGLVAIVAIVAVLLYTNIIPLGMIPVLNELVPEEEPCTGCSEYDTNDIFMMLQGLSGRTLNYLEAESYINSLHMQAYGVNGKTPDTIINEYKGTYASLMFLGQQNRAATGWDAILAAWLQGTEIKSVAAGSGATVTSVYGYDALVLTSYGPYTTYQSFITWLNS